MPKHYTRNTLDYFSILARSFHAVRFFFVKPFRILLPMIFKYYIEVQHSSSCIMKFRIHVQSWELETPETIRKEGIE